MKDEIFGKARYGGMSFNTAGLVKILKDEFTETKCMDDESYPRYMPASLLCVWPPHNYVLTHTQGADNGSEKGTH